MKFKIIQTIEDSAHHFLLSMKTEVTQTKEASVIVQKYIKEGTISKEEELKLKLQLMDSLKIIGILVPFILIPGASILMPILIKVAAKHKIELMPSAFNKKDIKPENK